MATSGQQQLSAALAALKERGLKLTTQYLLRLNTPIVDPLKYWGEVQFCELEVQAFINAGLDCCDLLKPDACRQYQITQQALVLLHKLSPAINTLANKWHQEVAAQGKRPDQDDICRIIVQAVAENQRLIHSISAIHGLYKTDALPQLHQKRRLLLPRFQQIVAKQQQQGVSNEETREAIKIREEIIKIEAIIRNLQGSQSA